MSFFQQFDNREKAVCKMGQTGHAKFIKLAHLKLCVRMVETGKLYCIQCEHLEMDKGVK